MDSVVFLQRVTMLVALVALGLALVLLGWRIYDQFFGTLVDMKKRLNDLQEEQDYMVEQLSKRPDFCDLSPDPGPCRGRVQRWYFLPRSGDCLEFPWGGCQGNQNNFISLAQCRAACRVEGGKDGPVSTTQMPKMEAQMGLRVRESRTNPSPDCFLAPQAGPCGDRVTRYYHDHGHCRPFQYGGCAGNANNFFSLAECHRQCLVAAVEDTKMSSEGEKRRWKGFQGSEEDLKRDSLTGGDNWGVEQEGNGRALSGKGKNAVGKRKWEKIIGTCHQPPNIGTCESSVARWWWDEIAGTCRQFQWTGCGGNSNNFGSLEKCLTRCKGTGLL